jgi:DNA-binding transcriptional regulator YiaG
MLNELYSTTTEPLHRRIRITRRALELSQLELALHIGVSQSQFSLFEHGYLGLGEQRAMEGRLWEGSACKY